MDIAVDTDGRLLLVNLTPADISDSASVQMILDAIRKRWPWLKHLFVGGAYDRLQLMDKAAYLDFVLQIIRRREGVKGFEVQPRRWVVEPTFGWMTRWGRCCGLRSAGAACSSRRLPVLHRIDLRQRWHANSQGLRRL